MADGALRRSDIRLTLFIGSRYCTMERSFGSETLAPYDESAQWGCGLERKARYRRASVAVSIGSPRTWRWWVGEVPLSRLVMEERGRESLGTG